MLMSSLCICFILKGLSLEKDLMLYSYVAIPSCQAFVMYYAFSQELKMQRVHGIGLWVLL